MALGCEVEVCAEAGDAQVAIRAAKLHQPDVCVVGRDLPGDGLAAVRGICRAAPHAAVLVMAATLEVDDLLDAVRVGAIGYTSSASGRHQLRHMIRMIAAGEAVVPRSMVGDLLVEVRGGGPGIDVLTARERQVLGLLRRGHPTAEIAQRLGIRPVTVRRHISDLVYKLGVADRAALTA